MNVREAKEALLQMCRDSAPGPRKCGHCGGEIGPDITGRPMCYGCGPRDMAPVHKRGPRFTCRICSPPTSHPSSSALDDHARRADNWEIPSAAELKERERLSAEAALKRASP